MKKQLKGILFSLSLMTCVHSNTYAVDPTPGLYGGVIIGGSYMFPVTPYPNSEYINYLNNTYPDFTTNVPNVGTNSIGNLTYSFMGLVGGQLGYRYQNFRAEVEFMYNANNYDTLNVGNTKIHSDSNDTVYIGGQANVLAGFLNFYYDLLPPASVEAQVAPFVGLGIGYASIQNNFQMNIDSQRVSNLIPGTNTQFLPSSTAPAGQLIAGLLYFLDDFSFFSLDCRVFSTANISQGAPYTNKDIRYQLISGNLSFNGSFDLG